MNRLHSVVVAALFLVLAAGTGHAMTVAMDDFSYDDGDLTVVSGGTWAAHSGAGANPIQVVSGQAVVQHGSGSREDANIAFTPVSTGILTYSFDMSVTADIVAAEGGPDYEYFAHFLPTSGFDFAARLSVVGDVLPEGGDYRLGLATESSSEDAVTASVFNFGDTISIEPSTRKARSVMSSRLPTGVGTI